MRHPLFASFVVGTTTAFLVGIAVTEVVARWIFFSLFVGIPAGIVAGIVAIAATYAALTRRYGPTGESAE
ncbi:hypothetical protein E6P09_11820 [Haloferax mediterranei ATCC 33500]|uniref:DUF8147 domain-containing protein n=1 Tax=Haloferax mediterranei (strain ATCC 33500 / DSM 1411 / JCM 8866 / NBRC 14739 / NCIMB 2177 / R-4) TaxID=523841 RepID=M0J9E6_HALMT|nr:hypothetical protein [Haloferax mediterranei]AHZ21191.1 hypothetical protein BM92_00325 [Haloferax mediterranei ATCC 33500]EMA04350.1 hypothetical protein C439_01707 [Haloferax mediterranei ATCC 33500]MDX5989565.1 hypothetical protein [Haloferax mediterranei ATCC 33500]QCQ75923.1 hypothetical protein E6P09_11820 [Haloferax mediterranei ATCC 33500]